MTGKRLQHASLVALTWVTATLPLLAAGNSLPVYPNAASRLQGVPAGAGLALYETPDSTDKIDTWYGVYLPFVPSVARP